MTTIVNFMLVYAQAPVAQTLLERDVDAAAAAVRSLTGEVVVLVSSACTVAEKLARELDGAARVVGCDPSLGYIWGNESAVCAYLEDRRMMPSAPAGTSSEARVVSAAELMAADGKRWVWVDGAAEPVELAATVTCANLAEAAGVASPKAVYVGFPASTFYAPDATVEMTSDYVRVYGAKNCMARALREVCEANRRECCGRCVYGYEGGHQITAILTDVCNGRGRSGDVELVRDLAPVMEAQSLCEQGSALARAAKSAIELFGTEIERHYSRKACDAGECDAFMTFHILPDKCVGCGECADVCEEEAILGKNRFVHVIDQKACTKCGACVAACEEGAIIRAGADKPRTPPRPIPCKRR